MLFKAENLSETMQNDTLRESRDARLREIAEQLGRELEEHAGGIDESSFSGPADRRRSGRDERPYHGGQAMRGNYAGETYGLYPVDHSVGADLGDEFRRQNPRHHQKYRGRRQGNSQTRSMIRRWGLLGCALGFTMARFWVGG